MLERIQSYFNGVGSIFTKKGEKSELQVSSIKDIKIVIDHFDKYPLKTKKLADYILFKKAFNLILTKEHLTTEGLRKVVSIRASSNNGLSDELKAAFPNTIPAPRPEVDFGRRLRRLKVGSSPSESLINHP